VRPGYALAPPGNQLDQAGIMPDFLDFAGVQSIIMECPDRILTESVLRAASRIGEIVFARLSWI
jgi:hypothetical protein